MDYKDVMDVASRGLEVVGGAVIIVGFLIGLARALRDMLRGQGSGAYVMVRKYFGQSILLGLEILVAADLIRTVVVDMTMENVLVLGALVLIRTFLSFSLQVEIYGRLPWRASKAAKASDACAVEPE
jgi:uncharacterized membrane protein